MRTKEIIKRFMTPGDSNYAYIANRTDQVS